MSVAACLRVFSIVNDIDTDVDLAFDDLANSLWKTRRVLCSKRILSVAPYELIQVIGPRQITGMRYQDAVYTASQYYPPLVKATNTAYRSNSTLTHIGHGRNCATHRDLRAIASELLCVCGR